MNLISKARLVLKKDEEFIQGKLAGAEISVSTHELARGILNLAELIKPAELSRSESTIVSMYKMSMPHVDSYAIDLAVRRIPDLFGESIEYAAKTKGINDAFAMINSALMQIDSEL